MNKLKQVKQAMLKTPPERLAKIEYQSLFMHMLGVTTVCIILIAKGFWWILFAFVFSLGVSYSQFVSARQKYNAIVSLVGIEKYNYKKDKSPSRKRDYIVKEAFGKYMWIAVLAPLMYLLYDTSQGYAWYWSIPFTIITFAVYVFLYFFVLHWFALRVYRRKMNG